MSKSMFKFFKQSFRLSCVDKKIDPQENFIKND